MKRVLASLLILVCGCAPSYRPPAGHTAYGAHPFKNVVANANPPVTLEGTVLLGPDTVVMTLGGRACVAEIKQPGAAFRYTCGGYAFAFNRDNPLRSNQFQVHTTIWRTRQICDSYRENPTTKAEQCVRYRTERYASRETVQGSLIFVAPKH